jgi:hypothetical protein
MCNQTSGGGGDPQLGGYGYAITVVWSMIVSPILSDVATPSSYVLQVRGLGFRVLLGSRVGVLVIS